MKVLALLSILGMMSTGCSSLNQLKYEQMSGGTFKIKQTISDDILCVKTKKKIIECYHVTGRQAKGR